MEVGDHFDHDPSIFSGPEQVVERGDFLGKASIDHAAPNRNHCSLIVLILAPALHEFLSMI